MDSVIKHYVEEDINMILSDMPDRAFIKYSDCPAITDQDGRRTL